MTFDSLQYCLFCVIAVLALNSCHSQRAWLVMGLNFAFVASFFPDLTQALPLIGFLVLGYGAVTAAPHVNGRGLLLLITAIITLFIWLKKYTITNGLPTINFPYVIVGLSYILFRVLHLMVDVNQGALHRPNPLSYTSYLLFFPTFVSGPIQRFQDYTEQMTQPEFPVGIDDVHEAFSRIVRGLFLIAVLTQGTLSQFESNNLRFDDALISDPTSVRTSALFATVAAIYIIHLYLNFSGYMDITIGISRLCGIKLPENFRRPYLANNLLDLWSRWHITLSEWFKTYLFNPILKALSERWATPARIPYLGVIAFFTTFGLMGIWHGSTGAFLVYGLLLGSGVALNKLYQIEIIKHLGKKRYKILCGTGWYRHLARAIGLSFFTIAVACIWLNPNQLTVMATPAGIKAGIFGFIILTVVITVLDGIIEAVVSLWRRTRWPSLPSLPPWSAPAWTAIKLLIVVSMALVFDSGAPEFVYKMF